MANTNEIGLLKESAIKSNKLSKLQIYKKTRSNLFVMDR